MLAVRILEVLVFLCVVGGWGGIDVSGLCEVVWRRISYISGVKAERVAIRFCESDGCGVRKTGRFESGRKSN